jgi:gliding motility-associated-like protein
MATGLPTGTYVATVTDANGCAATQSTIIAQPAALVATATKASDVLCHGGSTGKAYVTVMGGTQPYLYQWNTASTQLTDTAFNLAMGAYTATVTDAHGCVATSSISIAQPALLAVTTSPTPVLCFGTATGNAAAISTGGTPPMTYSWNTTPIQTTTVATAVPSGTYLVVVTDLNGCSANASANITTPTPVDIALQSTTAASCYGFSNGTATVLGTGGTAPLAYSWNTTQTTTTATASNLGAGIYQAMVTDAHGCQDSISVIITQPTALVASAVETHRTCPDDRKGSAYVSASGGTPPLAYLWNSTPAQVGNALLQVGPGAYSVTVTDQNGCSTAAPVTVGAFPKPEVIASNDTAVCEGTSVQLSATGAPGLIWSPAAGLSCISCPNPSLRAFSTTTYTVVGTNEWFCSDTDAVTVSVYQRTPVSVGGELNICIGESAQLSATGGVAYQWSPSQSLSNPTSAQPVAKPDSSTRYTVYITESPCFTDTLHQWVRVYPRPTVDAGHDFHGLPGVTVSLAATATGASKVSWTPAEGLSCPTCFETKAVLGSSTTTYTATATSDKGCAASDDVTVTIGCNGEAFFIPNTFTPNGDGQNDRFYARGPGIGTVTSFRVYNRWGELVFDGQNMPADCAVCGWDGTHRGTPMKPDVYVYLVETRCLNGETVKVQGDISLLR